VQNLDGDLAQLSTTFSGENGRGCLTGEEGICKGGIMSNISFKTELTDLINKCSMENASNTPDHILAMFLENCLKAWDEGVQQRETWYGRDARPGGI